MINKRNVWITLVFIILDLVCIKGLMIDIKDARFILGLAMCLFLTVAFARRIKIKPATTTQQSAPSADQSQPVETPSAETEEESSADTKTAPENDAKPETDDSSKSNE